MRQKYFPDQTTNTLSFLHSETAKLYFAFSLAQNQVCNYSLNIHFPAFMDQKYLSVVCIRTFWAWIPCLRIHKRFKIHSRSSAHLFINSMHFACFIYSESFGTASFEICFHIVSIIRAAYASYSPGLLVFLINSYFKLALNSFVATKSSISFSCIVHVVVASDLILKTRFLSFPSTSATRTIHSSAEDLHKDYTRSSQRCSMPLFPEPKGKNVCR